MAFAPFFLALILLCSTQALYAAEPAAAERRLSLREAVAAALERSPDLQDARLRHSARTSDAIEATALESPTLQADWLRQVDPASSSGLDVEFEQPLKLSNLTGARGRYADTLRDLADRELRLQTLKTIAEVRTLFMQLWLLRRQRSVLEASAEDSARTAEVIRKSASAGQVAPSEESLFRGEASRMRADINALDAEIGVSEATLGKELGQSLAGVSVSEPDLAPIPAGSDGLKRFASAHAPLREALQAEVRAAEARLGVAEEDSGFTFAPRLLYSRADDGAEQGVGVGIALTIPLWDTGQAEKTRARGELQSAQARLDTLQRAEPEGVIERLHWSALRQQARADSYERDVLPAFRQSYASIRRIFAQGQSSAFEVWQVRERLYQAEDAALKAKVDAYKARTLLEIEIGGLIEEVSP